MSNPDYIRPDGETLYEDDLEREFLDYLSEFEPFTIGTLTYDPGHVLQQVDPIAFRQGLLDWIDCLIQDGDLDEYEEGHPWIKDEEDED